MAFWVTVTLCEGRSETLRGLPPGTRLSTVTITGGPAHMHFFHTLPPLQAQHLLSSGTSGQPPCQLPHTLKRGIRGYSRDKLEKASTMENVGV